MFGSILTTLSGRGPPFDCCHKITNPLKTLYFKPTETINHIFQNSHFFVGLISKLHAVPPLLIVQKTTLCVFKRQISRMNLSSVELLH